jgi:hypothetical protein
MSDHIIEFEFNNQRFTDAAAGIAAFTNTLKGSWEEAAKALAGEVRDYLNQVADALAQRHGGSWPGGTTEITLSKRSGALTNAILGSVQVSGTVFDQIQGQIGAPGIPYASIQEFGGTIHAKGKLLTIPLPAALDSRGVPLKASAREWKNTFVAKSKKGNLIIFQKVGSTIIPLYVLKSQVTIPPRLGLGKTIQAGLPYFVDHAADAVVAAVLKGLNHA